MIIKQNVYIIATLFYKLYDNGKLDDTWVCSFYIAQETTVKSSIDLNSVCQSWINYDIQVNKKSKHLRELIRNHKKLFEINEF